MKRPNLITACENMWVGDNHWRTTTDMVSPCKFCDNTRRVHCENCNADGEREDDA